MRFMGFKAWVVYLYLIASFLVSGYVYLQLEKVEAERNQSKESEETNQLKQFCWHKSEFGRFRVFLPGIPQNKGDHNVIIQGQPYKAAEEVLHWQELDLTYSVAWVDLETPLPATALSELALFDNPPPRDILDRTRTRGVIPPQSVCFLMPRAVPFALLCPITRSFCERSFSLTRGFIG